METYRQTLENLQPKMSRKHFYVIILTGILYLGIGIINYYRSDINIWMGTIWILGGFGLIISVIIKKRTSEKYFIELNKNGIEAKVALFSNINIKWQDLEKINIKPISIVFELKSNTKEELSLGYLSYIYVIEIKTKLKEFADEKGIPIV